jgi:NAD dependent epimerase/dehydratase
MSEMKKVLVTGAGGFIGSHLVKRLIEVGYDVTALIKYNAAGSWGWLDTYSRSVLKEIKVELGDVRDPEQMMRYKNMNIIFHLAALIGIPYSYVAPRSYVDTNINGTLSMLQACRENGATLIHTSTSEVYGTALYEPIDEGHPIQAQSPYAATKNAADSLVRSYYLSFELPVVTVRPFNTFGPRQSLRAVIPTIVSQAGRGNVVKLGDSSTTRDFIFIHDTVEGFIKAAEKGKSGETYNIGYGKKRSISSVVEDVGVLLNKSLEIKTEQERMRPIKSEVRVLVCDNKKAKKELGWEIRWPFKKGLEYIVHDWERENRGRKDFYHV